MDLVRVPAVGARESEILELKRAAILDDLPKLVTVVVSMLNARGGTIWIGAEERDEVLVGFTEVRDAERHVRRIEDILVDTVEPPPAPGDVRVSRVDHASGPIIAIEVSSHVDGRPYSVLRDRVWRRYPIRVGARSRSMTREEIAAAFSGRAATEDVAATFEWAWGRELNRRERVLWVRAQLEPSLEIGTDRATRALLRRLVHEPAETGNRPMGWNFTSTLGAELDRKKEGIVVGGPEADTWLVFEPERGAIVFRVPIAHLEHRAQGEIYPYALIENLVSLVRLAVRLYSEIGADDGRSLFVDAGLRGVSGLELRPGSPRGLAFTRGPKLAPEDSLRAGTTSEPFGVARQAPDRLGWRLAGRLYEAFGLWPDDMPQELWDDQRFALVFPDS